MTRATKRRARSVADEVPIPFHERLTALLMARGLTQMAVAQAMGVTHAVVCRAAAGQRRPSANLVRRLALALSMSERALLQGTDAVGLLDGLGYLETPAEREMRELRTALREKTVLYEDLLRRYDALEREAARLRGYVEARDGE